MARRLLPLAPLALAAAACTVVEAGPEATRLAEAPIARPGAMPVFSDLANVPGYMTVVGEVRVANAGRPVAEVEQDLVQLARARGANAIVLHPFNRRALNVDYAVGAGIDDPFRYSSATAIRMEPTPSPRAPS